ncbi:MAG: hypothetical protein A3B86_00800 [Candidatus Yanofskybacteria bacterium RIFCSPHIGHO2_02_FULL_38_22b]|uniref:Uncharacterized protein n=1 Tax=Candidatus Yanofskybacteria bacterium RIFCSPHIGHO2_02_FULL_38_22b TaxID=1802673 RepID=A0A1F8F0L7_9BACT|nr:MAG: hypothetical protein A2816_00515 [Candidatus Yanofskybacteria bacterium RIFCSPHIGHO2_01_FULL_39_44]OGN06684.1 MAG: hypothetical protein A3B86_00800 [Candidatus Yanofskybacteria bacterium RIFCSPHIGHO2_02_FULL_38_22b]OGN19942.1 MAG: hypothetical protein A2910_00330 [Candidatus Yanofskybacteria bacterium RIFCSPLOWO2_01_FULL_39_28]
MKFKVYCRPNTSEDVVRLIVNVPFLRSRSKSVPIRITYSGEDRKIVRYIEIFVPESLISEVPNFFTGELKMLSSQILDVQRA